MSRPCSTLYMLCCSRCFHRFISSSLPAMISASLWLVAIVIVTFSSGAFSIQRSLIVLSVLTVFASRRYLTQSSTVFAVFIPVPLLLMLYRLCSTGGLSGFRALFLPKCAYLCVISLWCCRHNGMVKRSCVFHLPLSIIRSSGADHQPVYRILHMATLSHIWCNSCSPSALV